jgi:hypothetical protein
VYGIRRKEPTRFGTAVSRNSSETERVMPMLPRLITMIVHSTQTLKPRCSAKIDQARFFLATFLPVVSQNPSSSGSQCSIQRPLLEGLAAASGVGGATSGASVAGVVSVMAAR